MTPSRRVTASGPVMCQTRECHCQGAGLRAGPWIPTPWPMCSLMRPHASASAIFRAVVLVIRCVAHCGSTPSHSPCPAHRSMVAGRSHAADGGAANEVGAGPDLHPARRPSHRADARSGVRQQPANHHDGGVMLEASWQTFRHFTGPQRAADNTSQLSLAVACLTLEPCKCVLSCSSIPQLWNPDESHGKHHIQMEPSAAHTLHACR